MSPTIIVPTRNRASDLRAALVSLIEQEYKENYEIIVVDNGSTDSTKDVFEEISRCSPYNIKFKYDYEPIPGLLSGRHKGAMLASNDILIFIDDDIKADIKWLNSIMNAFLEKNVDMVGGPSYPMYEINPPEWEKELWHIDGNKKFCGYYSLIDLGAEGKHIDPNFVWGLNFSITKNALYKCGGFHPDCIPSNLQMYQGDGETGLTQKFKELNLKAWYAPGARVGHLVSKDRLTLDYIYKREFYQGVCNSYSLIRRHKLAGWRLTLKCPSVLKMKFKKIFFKFIQNKESLKMKMINGYLDGYNYHQVAVGKDKKLIQWILKEDYWDYRLPTTE